MGFWKLELTVDWSIDLDGSSFDCFRIEVLRSTDMQLPLTFQAKVYRRESFKFSPSFDITGHGDNRQSFDHELWVFDDQFAIEGAIWSSPDQVLSHVVTKIRNQLAV